MIYFVNWAGDMSEWPAHYGVLRSPRNWNMRPVIGRAWCVDNDAFHGLVNPPKLKDCLSRSRLHASTCRFVAVPDVVADAEATSKLWNIHAPWIREIGYPAAFVLQDGHEPKDIPPDADAVFVGGSTEFKMSSRDLIREAKDRNLWVHVGRVNSQRRIAFFASLGADSADGTTINRAPELKRRELSVQLHQTPLPLSNCARPLPSFSDGGSD